jgi:hypothetical protein
MSEPTPIDSLWRAFRKLVRAELPTVAYLAVYEYTVFAVLAGTMTAHRSDPTLPIPDVVAIPIRSGIPGATVVASPGSSVYVFFANGDPSRPRVLAYDNSAAASVGFDCSTGTAEHLLTVEALVNILITLQPLIAPGGTPTPITDATLAAAITSSVTGDLTSTAPLSLAATLAALVAKAVSGGDSSGTKPGVGCPNITGG